MKDSIGNKGKGAVTLSTFHSSKGLEFDRVMMVDLQSDIIPSHKEFEELKLGNRDLMEEAARLFYVGMTRAKKDLVLIHHGRSSQASTFYKDVEKVLKGASIKQKEKKKTAMRKPKEVIYVEYEKGMKLAHKSFGTGVVEEIVDDVVTIEFEMGTKRLSKKQCAVNGLLQPV